MNHRSAGFLRKIVCVLIAVGTVWILGLPPTCAAKIRLKPAGPPAEMKEQETILLNGEDASGERRGFDYEAFQRRLQNHWFQRKAFLAEGRNEDARLQSEKIRAFCAEEGVGRLRHLGDALIVESDHLLEKGRYAQAMDSLHLAEDLDPGRPEVSIARAWVIWKSGQGAIFSAFSEYITGLRRGITQSAVDFRLPNRFFLSLILALLGAGALFSILMMLRYQIPFRHQVEEWFSVRGRPAQGKTVAWVLLTLPALLWFTAGWIGFYWLAAVFRFMRRLEKTATILLLLAAMLCVPMFRVAVAVYGMTTDPVVRATLQAASGPYTPDRVVEMQSLVDAYPDDATFRFLLAGLYAKGQFFGEAFQEYQRALEVDPELYQAEINIGNIYYQLQNYDEAGAYYLRVLETHPDSILALHNLYRSHAEGFRFTESEEALDRARELDSEEVTRLMARSEKERTGVVDADLNLGSVWTAAFEGGSFRTGKTTAVPGGSFLRRFLNPVSVVALLTMVVSLLLAGAAGNRHSARRCIRCGRAFCNRCKTGREGHEYCSQCLHLFVLGDGLAPETKTRKMFEVERHEKATRLVRRYAGWVFPGATQILQGRLLAGCVLLVFWFSALLTWKPAVFRSVEWLTGFDLRYGLLFSGQVPAVRAVDAAGVTGLIATLILWIVAAATAGREA